MDEATRRQIERDEALPWSIVLAIENPETATERLISRCYRAFARESDGDEAELRLLNRARDEALAYVRRREARYER